MQKQFTSKGITYTLEWPAPSEAAKCDVLALWKAENAFDNPEARINQIIGVARDNKSGELLANATTEPSHIPQIDQMMFRYRTFAAPNARQQLISLTLLALSFDFLAECNLESRTANGLYLEIESQILMQHENDALWPRTRFAYMGTTPEGWHQRIRYFEYAELKPVG